jgi:MFS family permease
VFVDKYLGITELPQKTQRVMTRFFILNVVTIFTGAMSSTFFILYIIDKIGFTQAGIMLAIVSLTQLTADYPSGSLGDYIGQRWVLIIAYTFYALGYLLLTVADSLFLFAIIAVINGLGNAQASGTLFSWLDNNYKKTVANNDSNRSTYGYAINRMSALGRYFSLMSFVIGGLIATVISRSSVFFVQMFLALLVVSLIFLLMTESETSKEDNGAIPNKKENFITCFKGGITFFISSKKSFFFLLGCALPFAAITIFGQMILFPIYFGYTGSDGAASLFRGTMFFIGIPIAIFITPSIAKRLSKKLLPTGVFISMVFYYIPFILLLEMIPTENKLNLVALIIAAIVLIISVNVFGDINNALRQRTMIDLVPSEHRHSVYSLIPTLVTFITIPILPFTGYVVENFGLGSGIYLPLLLGLFGAFSVYLSKAHLEEEQLN